MHCSCRHVRAIVSLALEALASAKGRSGMQSKTNQRIVQAMRLRYGLDDNRPRTYVEVSAVRVFLLQYDRSAVTWTIGTLLSLQDIPFVTVSACLTFSTLQSTLADSRRDGGLLKNEGIQLG